MKFFKTSSCHPLLSRFQTTISLLHYSVLRKFPFQSGSPFFWGSTSQHSALCSTENNPSITREKIFWSLADADYGPLSCSHIQLKANPAVSEQTTVLSRQKIVSTWCQVNHISHSQTCLFMPHYLLS